MSDPLWIILLNAILSVGAIPTLAALYLSKAVNKKDKAGTDIKPIKRWFYGNVYLYFLIAGIAIYGYSQMQIFEATKPKRLDEPGLKYLTLDVYEKELKKHPQQKSVANWDNIRRQLLRKFELAEFAWKKHDKQASIDALRDLEAGRDTHGPLYSFPSFVVSNDLACVYFDKMRNKEFKAYTYLLEAAKRVPPASPYKDDIDENLKRLDILVNTLD